MQKRLLFLLVIVLVLSGATYLLATHFGDGESKTMNHSAHQAMISSERDFIEHMIPHHEEAIYTANQVLERGGSLRPLRDLAAAIASSQTVEVEEMRSWYVLWYATPYENTGVYSSMMRSLNELSGAELDRVFLEDMIVHHEAAVAVAKAVLELSISEETEALATKIISTQENEIYLMKDLLKLLPQ